MGAGGLMGGGVRSSSRGGWVTGGREGDGGGIGRVFFIVFRILQ